MCYRDHTPNKILPYVTTTGIFIPYYIYHASFMAFITFVSFIIIDIITWGSKV